MSFPVHISDQTVSVFVAGKLYQADRSTANWARIKEALADETTTEAEIVELLCPIVAITAATCDTPEITVRGGAVYFGEEVVHSALADRILDIAREGLPLDVWVAFATKVYANPSTYARDEFYTWLEDSGLPITPDGDFIAYKGVKKNYTDNYSGTFDNHIGQVVVMPGGRAACDTNRDRDCSAGLHFCSKGYLPFGERVMLVKINPADVISFPRDQGGKGRTWRYEVVGEVDPEEAKRRIWKPVVNERASYSDYEPELAEEEFDVEPDDKFNGGDRLVFPVSVVVDPELTRLLEEEAEIERRSRFTLPDEFDVEPGMVTKELGVLTASRFKALLAEAGGKCSTLADSLGIPKGTVRKWKKKLLG